VPYQKSTDVRVTPFSSNDIQRINSDYLRDSMAKRKLPLLDTTVVVDPTTLDSDAAHPAPSTKP